jgi:hypothetical protein
MAIRLPMPAAQTPIAQIGQERGLAELQGAFKQVAGPLTQEQQGQVATELIQKADEYTLQGYQQQEQSRLQGEQRAMQEKQLSRQQQLSAMQKATAEKEAENRKALEGLAVGANAKLLDREMQFQRDQNGLKLWSARKLADFAITKAKNDEELAGMQQTYQQYVEKKQLILDALYKKITQAQEQEYLKGKQAQNADTMRILAQKKASVEKMRLDAMKQKKDSTAIWAAGGAIVGAVAGTLIGPGAGTAMGAVVGSTLGTGLGSIIGSTVGSDIESGVADAFGW